MPEAISAPRPSTITVRVIVAVLLGWLVKVAEPDWPQAALLVAAFLIGIVSETFLTSPREVYRAKWVGRLTGDVEEPVPLKTWKGSISTIAPDSWNSPASTLAR